MAMFTGSADGDLQAALTAAVKDAQHQLAMNIFDWKLKSITGSKGGFTNANTIKVTITAAPAPSETRTDTFPGSSDGNLQEALTKAVEDAQGKLAMNIFNWKIEAITGSKGGFTNANTIEVTITAAPAPSETRTDAFPGSSSSNLQEALTQAVEDEYRQLATNMINWKLVSVTGSKGGFTNANTIEVTITAEPA